MSTPADNLPPVPVTPDLFIPQVPFKQLPFPWNDLTNTPQPDATQYYPDHAPSVVATIAGMHPTNQQGQTLNTDGNHRLLVNTGESSSSRPATIQPLYPFSGATTPNSTGTQDLCDISQPLRPIYQISLSAVVWASSISDPTSVSCYIELSGPFPYADIILRNYFPVRDNNPDWTGYVAYINDTITLDPGLSFDGLISSSDTVSLRFFSSALHQFAICCVVQG